VGPRVIPEGQPRGSQPKMKHWLRTLCLKQVRTGDKPRERVAVYAGDYHTPYDWCMGVWMEARVGGTSKARRRHVGGTSRAEARVEEARRRHVPCGGTGGGGTSEARLVRRHGWRRHVGGTSRAEARVEEARRRHVSEGRMTVGRSQGQKQNSTREWESLSCLLERMVGNGVSSRIRTRYVEAASRALLPLGYASGKPE
jgi:hypothetical protein